MSSHTLRSVLSALALGACSVVGVRSGTEMPPYTRIEQLGPTLEVRAYQARVAAEIVTTGSKETALRAGFRRLASYIFGANATRVPIAMTAPVAADPADAAAWRIRFFLPAALTAAEAPRPDDPAISIVAVPPQTIAVYRYSGLPTAKAAARAQRELLGQLGGSGWLAQGAPTDWYYDPPWTLPPLRRNEAVVAVVRPPIPSASAPRAVPPEP